MKTLILIALLGMFGFTAIAGSEQLLLTTPAGGNSYTYPTQLKYIGNNKLLTVYSLMDTSNYYYGSYSISQVAIVLSDLQNNTIFSKLVNLSNQTNYVTVLDAGVCAGGGYYLYLNALTNFDTVYYQYSTYKNILIKLDVQGNLVWNSVILPPAYGYGMAHVKALQDNGGNFYVGVDNAMGLSIARINSNGDFAWGRTISYDTTKNPLFDITLTTDSGILCSGKAQNDKTVAVLNTDGSVRWSYAYGNGNYTRSYAVKQCASGGFITGGFSGAQGTFCLTRYNSNGTMLWDKLYLPQSGSSGQIHDLVETPDGSIVAVGQSYGQDVIFRTDAQGNVIESKIFSTGGYNSYYGLPAQRVLSEGNNLIITDAGLTDYNNQTFAYFFRIDGLNRLCSAQDNPMTEYDVSNTNYTSGTLSTLIVQSFTSDNSMPITLSDVTVPGSMQQFCAASAISQTPEDGSIRLYPNPATNQTTVSVPFANGNIRIVDAVGNLISQTPIRSSETVINTSSLSQGLYFLQVENSDKNSARLVKKLIVR
jgi:hypothetical protein